MSLGYEVLRELDAGDTVRASVGSVEDEPRLCGQSVHLGKKRSRGEKPVVVVSASTVKYCELIFSHDQLRSGNSAVQNVTLSSKQAINQWKVRRTSSRKAAPSFRNMMLWIFATAVTRNGLV
jgi:hypothetical protein